MNITNKINCWIAIAFLLVFSNSLIAEDSKDKSLELSHIEGQGKNFFQRGDFENAIIQWTDLAKRYKEQKKTTEQNEVLIQLANAHYALGHYKISIEILDRANKTANKDLKNSIINSLGMIYLANGQYSKADKLLQESVAMARKKGETVLLIESLNNLGGLKVKKGMYNNALDIYAECIKLAKSINNRELIAKSSVNMAIVSFEIESRDNVGAKVTMARTSLEETEDDHNKAFRWVTLGNIGKKLVNSTLGDKSDWQSFAHFAFKQAVKIGERISDVRVVSHAKASLGKVYSDWEEYEEALDLTQEAIVAIENIKAPDMLYQWQWQKGRILKIKGDKKNVVAAYQQAVGTFNSICNNELKQQLNIGAFQRDIRPLYLELINLLLQVNDTLKEGKAIQQNLVEVQSAIEQLRAAELQDYYKDVCTSNVEENIKEFGKIDNETAVIYPIMFKDRMEILLSLSKGGLKRFTIPVDRQMMINKLKLFRIKLKNRTTTEYLPYAEQLYKWLIFPLQTTLREHKINSLVMVPDESLRTIPIAALHDGKKFLIENYAIANVPGLSTLTSKRTITETSKILALGVAESVQGYSVLDNVETELTKINKIFPGNIMLDKKFQLKNVKKEITEKSYDILHIASHGQFKNHAKKNFVLTYNDRLNMDSIEQLIETSRTKKNSIELLTLSATQTSLGDDLSVLGLTGLAVKVGVRSAVATLWLINDQAASILLTDLYGHLKKGVKKVQAIKNAQVLLMKNKRYQHPYYWSPFLLIGDWL